VRQGRHCALGPDVQSAADADDPLEVRVYGGRDADFTLYEDKGDGYAYERGERAIIPMHWDDGRKTLVIGERKGEFPGLRKERTFRIVCVKRHWRGSSDGEQGRSRGEIRWTPPGDRPLQASLSRERDEEQGIGNRNRKGHGEPDIEWLGSPPWSWAPPRLGLIGRLAHRDKAADPEVHQRGTAS